MLTFSLSPDPTLPWYAVFYLLGFGVAGALLIQARARLGVPWRPWLLLVAGTVLALVLGTRLGADAAGGRSVLTGLLVAVPVLAGLRRLLGLDRRAADAFAGPLLLGLAVQSVGCLLTGCCFGHVAGWGVCYGPDTAVFNWQVARGLLAPFANHSAPVVPVPALQIGWYLLVATALVGARRRGHFKQPGTSWLVALTAFTAGRLVLEGLRDPAADFLGTTVVFGLKQTQWALLAATAAGVALLTWRRRVPPATAAPAPDQPLPNLLVLLTLLAVTLWPTTAPLLTGVEVLLVRLLLTPVLALEAGRVVRLARQHPILPGLLTLSILLMSQVPVAPPVTPPAALPVAPAPPPARPTTTLLLGGTGGSAYQLLEPHASCNPSYPNIKSWPGYDQTSGAAMVGVERTWPRPDGSTVALGARLSRGTARVSYYNVQLTPSYAVDSLGYQYLRYDTTIVQGRLNRPLTAFSPYLQYNHRTVRGGWVRMRFGMHLGKVAYDYVVSPNSVRRVTPELLFETQGRRGLLLHASINDGLLGVGNGTWRTGVGLTPGAQRWALLLGAATTNANGQHFVQLQILGDDQNFHAPIGAFAELRLQPTPQWQLLVSGQSNFNDFRTVTASARLRLGK